MSLWTSTTAPKVPLDAADGDEAESVRVSFRERVSSPCGEDGEVEPAGHLLGGGGCAALFPSSRCMTLCSKYGGHEFKDASCDDSSDDEDDERSPISQVPKLELDPATRMLLNAGAETTNTDNKDPLTQPEPNDDPNLNVTFSDEEEDEATNVLPFPKYFLHLGWETKFMTTFPSSQPSTTSRT